MKLIQRNGQLVKVTDGAFKEIFRPQGWTEVIEEKVVLVDDQEEQKEVNEELDKLEEKPLSKWTAKETKAYAEFYEIDVTGTKNSNEAKEIIKDFLN